MFLTTNITSLLQYYNTTQSTIIQYNSTTLLQTTQQAMGDKESDRAEKNYELLEPFVRWLQQLRFNGTTTLKRVKVNYLSLHRNYAVLSDMGKRVKLAEPVGVWAKVERLGDDSVGVEVVNLPGGRRFLFKSRRDDFPFDVEDLDTGDFGGIKVERDACEGTVLHCAGCGYRIGPEGPVIDRVERMTPIDGPNGEVFDDADGDVAIHDVSSSEASSSYTPSENNSDSEEPIPPQPPQQEVVHNEVVRLKAQLLVKSIQLDQMRTRLAASSKDKPPEFNIQDYILRKVITSTSNGLIYGVEHSQNRSFHSVKEVIIHEASITSDKEMGSLSRELRVMKAFQQTQETSPHVLFFEETYFENTPLRVSCYLLTAPAAISLSDSINTLQRLQDKISPIVAYQILKGLEFLTQHTGCIHGNLNCNNIVMSFNGEVMISSFDHSFKLQEQVHPEELLDDVDSIQYKHTYLLIAHSLSPQLVEVKATIDIFSIGVILYRLLTKYDLFNSTNSLAGRENLQIPEEISPLVKPFLVSYEDSVSIKDVLQWDMFKSAKDANVKTIIEDSV